MDKLGTGSAFVLSDTKDSSRVSESVSRNEIEHES